MDGYATLILLSKKQARIIEVIYINDLIKDIIQITYECKKLKGLLDPERAIFKPENTYTKAATIAIILDLAYNNNVIEKRILYKYFIDYSEHRE